MIVDDDGCIVTPFLRTAYNYDTNKASDESGLFCADPSRTQQEYKEECDINTIVDRFGIGADLPIDPRVPLTDEFVETIDYRTALDKLREADIAFMEFPAAIRARFENDAGKFVDFVSDPANIEQAREWGLARLPEAPQAPIAVRVISESPQPTKSA